MWFPGELEVGGAALHAAERANAAVTLKGHFADIARVAAKAPFMRAPVRTEREVARRDIEAAPAAGKS